MEENFKLDRAREEVARLDKLVALRKRAGDSQREHVRVDSGIWGGATVETLEFRLAAAHGDGSDSAKRLCTDISAELQRRKVVALEDRVAKLEAAANEPQPEYVMQSWPAASPPTEREFFAAVDRATEGAPAGTPLVDAPKNLAALNSLTDAFTDFCDHMIAGLKKLAAKDGGAK